MFVDSHAHIDGPEFDRDRDEVIQRARDAGVSTILNIGTGDPHSGALERAVELAEKHEDIYASVGTHPHDARLFDDKAEQRIASLIKQSARVIAWGEIGLARLPVIIHTREAEDETIEILKSHPPGINAPGVMHCFSGSLRLAQEAIELGFVISFSGIVTFNKAEGLRAIARQVPLDRLLIETDCPFLSPVPFRGKRNEPAYVVEVARCLAGLRELSLEEVARMTSTNFARLFRLQLD